MNEEIKKPSLAALSEDQNRLCGLLNCHFHRPNSRECHLMKETEILDRNRLADDPYLSPKDSHKRRAIFLRMFAAVLPAPAAADRCPRAIDRFYLLARRVKITFHA